MMTPKKFIRGSKSLPADKFLAENRSFLNNYSFLNDVLSAYDNKQILPTPALQMCQGALHKHLIARDLKDAEEAIQNNIGKSGAASKTKKKKFFNSENKPYSITIMVKNIDRNGNVTIDVGTVSKIKVVEEEGKVIQITEEVPMVYGETTFGAAERLADRRLFQVENAVHAEIVNNNGVAVKTIVSRNDAISRVLREKKLAAHKSRPKTASLKWTKTMRAKSDHCNGPWNY